MLMPSRLTPALDPVAEQKIVTEGGDGDINDCVPALVAEVVRAADAVVKDGNPAPLAATGRIAGLGAIAKQPVVTTERRTRHAEVGTTALGAVANITVVALAVPIAGNGAVPAGEWLKRP